MAALPPLGGPLAAFSPLAGAAFVELESEALPVVLEAWLLELLLVALTCPLATLLAAADAVDTSLASLAEEALAADGVV